MSLHFGEDDRFVSLEEVAAIEAALGARPAWRSTVSRRKHGFAQADVPAYDKARRICGRTSTDNARTPRLTGPSHRLERIVETNVALMVCVRQRCRRQTRFLSVLSAVPRQNHISPLTSVEYWRARHVDQRAFRSRAVPVWGGLGDRIGRKKMVVRSSVASGIAMALMGLCTTPGNARRTRALGCV